MTRIDINIEPDKKLIGLYGRVSDESGLITQLGFILLDTTCLANYVQESPEIEDENGSVEFIVDEPRKQEHESYINAEVILGVLLFALVFLTSCIIWVSCHPTKDA